jgi:hypothetical protein
VSACVCECVCVQLLGLFRAILHSPAHNRRLSVVAVDVPKDHVHASALGRCDVSAMTRARARTHARAQRTHTHPQSHPQPHARTRARAAHAPTDTHTHARRVARAFSKAGLQHISDIAHGNGSWRALQ